MAGILGSRCVPDLSEARLRIGRFIDYYNVQRTNQGIGNLVPADRCFTATPAVRQAIQTRVAANALKLARQGLPKTPFYLTSIIAGHRFTFHAEGETVILQKGNQRSAIALDPRPAPVLPPSGDRAKTTAIPPAAVHTADMSPPPSAPSTLRDHYAGIARRNLACMMWSARPDSHAQAQRRFYQSVAWLGVGRVWAMDHNEPPTPIDGRYRFLLTVRDLASGATWPQMPWSIPKHPAPLHCCGIFSPAMVRPWC